VNARQKAKDLINLAIDDAANDKERVAAAMKAIKIIHDNDLLSSPLDGLLESDNDTVRAASSILDKLTDPDLIKNVKKVAGSFKGRRR
jgi:hypothetical protein